MNEFLPTLVGRDVVEKILNAPPRYPDFVREPFIPLEFADAAYRYGHSQIRHRYQLNRSGDSFALFPELIGFQPVPKERRVDWTLFFDAPGRTSAQRAKKLDGRLVRALITLPEAVTGRCTDDLRSLAVRDLMRGQGVGLPSGEALARHLGIESLSADEVGLSGMGSRDGTPLWYYILREADVREGGNRLGPLGGHFVAEVLIGLLRADRTTFLSADPHWRPSYSSEQPSMASLIRVGRAIELSSSATRDYARDAQSTHGSSVPRKLRRPSSVSTHARTCQGGSCRRCCVCPHSNSATHCCSASR